MAQLPSADVLFGSKQGTAQPGPESSASPLAPPPTAPAQERQGALPDASALFTKSTPQDAGTSDGIGGVRLGGGQGSDEEPAGFFDGVKYGIKEATNPFNVDRGEQSRALSSGASTAGYLLANIATSLGVNAALTAATGGAAGAVGAARQAATAKNIATGLYAIYQGLGRDRIRTKEEGRVWKPGSASSLLSVGLELNPLMKASSKLNAALRIGAQGLGEAALEGKHFVDKGDMATAAALGIIGAGIPIAHSVGRGPSAEAAAKAAAEEALSAVDATKTNTPEIFTKAQEKLKELGLDRPPEASSEFKRFLVGDTKAALDEEQLERAYAAKAKQYGEKKLDEAFAVMQGGKAYAAAAGDAVARNLEEMGEVGFKDVNLIKSKLMPVFYVTREVDDITGMDFAKLADKFAQAHNTFNTQAKYFTDRFVKLQEKAKALGLSGEDVSNIIEMDDEAALSALKKKHGAAIDSFRSELTEAMSGETGLLGYLKDMGYSPNKRANYLPEKAVKSTKLASILQGEAEALPKALKGRSLDDIRTSLAQARAAASGGEKGAIDALKASDRAAAIVDLLDSTAERIGLPPMKSLADFGKIKEGLLSGARWLEGADPDTELSALFARTGSVPGLIREKDAWKRIAGYINENMRAAHFEDALNYGKMYTGVLEQLGMKKTAEYFENYMKDQAGGARGLSGLMRKAANRAEYAGFEKMRKAASPLDANLGKALSSMPEFTSWLNGQVYTSKLATNVPGIIRNATQFLFTTVPEVGHKYGLEKAYAAAKAMTKNPEKLADMYREMEQKGVLSQHGRLETSELSKAFGGVKGKIDRFNENLFSFYQGTDKFNRAITWRMGREIAGDILADNKDAIRFVNDLDSGTKQELRSILKKNMGGKEKLDAVHDVVGRYLISKTQFDYSAANKAEWARLVGPYFSMFTTWPGMIASDIVHTTSSRGFAQGGRKILSKYLPLYGLMALASQQLAESDNKYNQKYFIADPKTFSPLDAVIPSASPMPGRGGILSNPLLQTAAKLGSGAVEDASALFTKGDVVPRKTGRAVLTEVAPTYLPVVAPILNEIDRFTRIKHGTKMTSKVADELGLKRTQEGN